MQEQPLAKILKGAQDSSHAIRGIYEYFRSVDSKWSLAFLCRHSGITSKGYLSEVINGKKILHEKHVQGLSQAFHLSPLESSYLETLVKIDRERSNEVLKELQVKQRSIGKQMQVYNGSSLAGFDDWLFSFAVFAAFGVLRSPVRFADLVDHFGRKNQGRVQRAVEMLVAHNLIKESGQVLEINFDQVRYGTGLGSQAQMSFLEQYFQYAATRAPFWFDRPSEAFVESSVISCKKSEYLKAIDKLRNYASELQSDLEASDGDDIVVFGVQLFPYR